MFRMRSRLIIASLVFCMIIGLNDTVKVLAQPKPKIVVDSLLHNYGDVIRGEKVSHAFVIKNQGKANLIIKDAKPG